VFDGWVWCSLGRLGLHLGGVLGWSDPDEPCLKIRPYLSPIAVEHITAIEWLVFDDIQVMGLHLCLTVGFGVHL
jgi:hypothetical protein